MKVNTKNPFYVIGFVVVVSAVFTAGIVALQIATAARVERNEKMRRYRALATLFAPSWGVGDVAKLSDEEVVKLVDGRVDSSKRLVDESAKPPVDMQLFWAYATADRKKKVGLAFPVGGNGFWAPIRGYLAVDPARKRALGIVFVEQKETPGLGARITEEAFTDQFQKKAREKKDQEPLKIHPPERSGAPFIYIGKGEPTGANDPRFGRSVDAITGATQTSLAVERFLNANLRRFHKAYRAGEIVSDSEGAGKGSKGAQPSK